MAYLDGVVIAVKTADRQAYLDYARTMDAIFIDAGATRIVEGWGDDVPHGQATDFYRAVAATEDETVVFSWIEWPDKAARDAAWESLRSDPRIATTPMPFDARRMIFGGFEALLQLSREPSGDKQ